MPMYNRKLEGNMSSRISFRKNKKTKLVAFWAFVLEFKEKMKQRGLHIHHSQLNELASPHWEKLSADEKEKYKEKAKRMDTSSVNRNYQRSNSLGKSIAQADEEARVKLQNQEAVIIEIKTMLESSNEIGELDDLVMHFIDVISFFEDNESAYPAELAIIKFSLKEGIINDIHICVNPGKLPKGAAYPAQLKSENIHKYPLPETPECRGETDYIEILEKIVKFLLPFEKLPIFFTERRSTNDNEQIEIAQKVFDKIMQGAQEDNLIGNVKIYPIDVLFYHLQRTLLENRNKLSGGNSSEKPFMSLASVDYHFKADPFCYQTRGCDFHQREDVEKYCALSRVRRWCYTFSKWFCEKNRYNLIEGKHFPNGHQV